MKRYYTTAADGRTFAHPDGPFVLWAEHAAELAEVQPYIDQLTARSRVDVDHIVTLQARLAEHAAQVAALKVHDDLATRFIGDIANALGWQSKGGDVNLVDLMDEAVSWIRTAGESEVRIARYESALTLLTNGMKYSTEVVTIARDALGAKP
jgi:hypothetical protein